MSLENDWATKTHVMRCTWQYEVEAIWNLSYTTNDDTEEPLTPAHLFVGRRLLSFPDDRSYEDGNENFDITSEQLQRKMKYLNSMHWVKASHFQWIMCMERYNKCHIYRDIHTFPTVH
jgi:hypothetical protein